MSKRRTRSEKSKAKHPFLISWNKPADFDKIQPVKRQKETEDITNHPKENNVKKAKTMQETRHLASTKKGVVKSIIISIIIITAEVVLYLAWIVK